MNARRLIPIRLRHHTRVISIQCGYCGCWDKPRHIRIPAMICRDCETTPGFQNWTPPAGAPAPPVRPALDRIR